MAYKRKKGLQKNQKGKPNSDLRLEARKCGVTLTEVGKWLGCKPAMMSYWLNRDLNEDQRFAIVAAIDCAKEEKKRKKEKAESETSSISKSHKRRNTSKS